MVKSRFLRLAYQTRVGGATDRGRLEAAETEVWHLRGELEASQMSKEESTHRKEQA